MSGKTPMRLRVSYVGCLQGKMTLPNFEEHEGAIQDSPPDPGIAPIVSILRQNGVETCQSCQGGPGHSSREPYVDFRGE